MVIKNIHLYFNTENTKHTLIRLYFNTKHTNIRLYIKYRKYRNTKNKLNRILFNFMQKIRVFIPILTIYPIESVYQLLLFIQYIINYW